MMVAMMTACNPGDTVIVVCNPSNPCGKVFTRNELLEILALAERHDAFVITDEPYEHIVFSVFILPKMRKHCGSRQTGLNGRSLRSF